MSKSDKKEHGKAFTHQRHQNRASAGRLVSRRALARRGFTLIEILIVVAVLSLLAAMIFAIFGGTREAGRRAQCDTNLKSIGIALNAYKEERGRYPRSLTELTERKYLPDALALICPSDPEEQSPGYNEGYVKRSTRNNPDHASKLPPLESLPVVLCPHHEEGGQGAQLFVGLQTQRFAVRPATLVAANATSLKRPGQAQIPATDGMALRGGDRLITASQGSALIRFADESTCTLRGGTDVTVLQSFLLSGQPTLYSLVRQTLGDVSYSVTHGSKFDVSTPTATAGALGTEFRIQITGTPDAPPASSPGVIAPPSSYSEMWINTSRNPNSEVFCSLPSTTTIIPRHQEVDVDALRRGRGRSGKGNGGGGDDDDDD